MKAGKDTTNCEEPYQERMYVYIRCYSLLSRSVPKTRGLHGTVVTSLSDLTYVTVHPPDFDNLTLSTCRRARQLFALWCGSYDSLKAPKNPLNQRLAGDNPTNTNCTHDRQVSDPHEHAVHTKNISPDDFIESRVEAIAMAAYLVPVANLQMSMHVHAKQQCPVLELPMYSI